MQLERAKRTIGKHLLAARALARAQAAGALAGRGPFAIHSPNVEVVLLQIFLITASVPLMAALVEKRRGLRRRPRIRGYDFAHKDL